MGNEVVWAGNILTPHGIMESGLLRIEGGCIQSVEQRGSYTGKIDLDAGEHLIAPGFVDMHVHGALGHHFMTSEREGVVEALRHHLKHGTTGLLATTTTASNETIHRALRVLSEIRNEQLQSPHAGLGAGIRGVHLEGPYFNPERAGAQNRNCLRQPDLNEFKEWEKHNIIRTVTIAPELPGAEAVIRYMRDHSRVLVSAGHTDASFEEIEASLAWGVSHCTHFTNAMRGFRECEPGVFEPGVFGAGLILQEMTVEVIADGIHVHPRILELIHRVKGADRVALITDAVPYCGLEDGVYAKEYGDRKAIVVRNGSVRLQECGGLAGSALTMNRAARQMAALGIPLTDVWQMAAATPARLIGLGERIGTIEPGKDADLIVINKAFEVQCAMVRGRIGYDRRMEVSG